MASFDPVNDTEIVNLPEQHTRFRKILPDGWKASSMHGSRSYIISKLLKLRESLQQKTF